MSLPNLKIRKQRIILISLPPFPRDDKCRATTKDTIQIRSRMLKALVRKMNLFGEQSNRKKYSQVKNTMVYVLIFVAISFIDSYPVVSSTKSSKSVSPIHEKIERVAINIVKTSYT